jgi:hypothetical protein
VNEMVCMICGDIIDGNTGLMFGGRCDVCDSIYVMCYSCGNSKRLIFLSPMCRCCDRDSKIDGILCKERKE